jgi:putative ABC transport system permease protein
VLDYLDRQRDLTAFEEQALYSVFNPTVDVNGVPERAHAMRVTPSFFRLIKVSPRTGRGFREAEGERGQDPAVVIGHGLAQRLFGSEDVVGRQVRVDGQIQTIVGVMAADFAFIDSAVQLWVPAVFSDQQKQVSQRLSNNWDYIGRLKRDASVSQAQAQVDTLNASNMQRFPMFKTVLTNAGFRSVAVPLQDDLVRDVRGALNLL